MESQIARPYGQSHKQEQHIVGHQMEGEDEHRHENKSVLKKVKAKAKKIKDTLTKHGHGHNHNHDHIPDDHDLDEEDDDDEEEEMVADPEIHGAPIYDPAVIKSVGTTEASGQLGVNTGRSTAMAVGSLPPPRTVKPGARSHVYEQDESKVPKVNFGLTSVMGEAPTAPQNTPVSHTSTETHHSTDHDPTSTFVPGQEGHPGQPKVNLQRPKGGLVADPAAPKDDPGAYTLSNYQSKVTDPTGRGGKEAGISPVLCSFDKMSIYDEPKPKSGHEQNWPTGTEDFYTSLPTGSHDQFSPELPPPISVSEETFDRTRTQEHPYDNTAVTGKTFDSTRTQERAQDNADDRQSNQSSYTEKISSATSAIADKAISAKNVVASKLGYGEQDGTRGHEVHEAGDKSNSSMPATALDYGKKIAVTVSEKLTPVYEKVTGAGSTVMSKMPGTNTGTGSDKEHGVGAQDKGVSVKDYFAEKFRPGEEDRVLSGVVSGALYKKKAEQENKSVSSRPVTEVISDALHKRKEEPNEATDRPVGKVTESDEVAMRLGTTEHDSSKEGTNSSFVNISDMGMVDKIKGTVGSWFGGKAEETQGSQQSHSNSVGSAFQEAGHNTTTTGERRLQESGN